MFLHGDQTALVFDIKDSYSAQVNIYRGIVFIHPHQVKEIMKFSFCNSLFECLNHL